MAIRQSDEKRCPLIFDLEGNPPDQNPAGQIYVQNQFLVIEFLGKNTVIQIPMSKTKKQVLFFENHIEYSPEKTGEKTLVFVPDIRDSQGRFHFYSLRDWVQQSESPKPYQKAAPPYYRFFDFPSRLLVLFQLAVPFLLYFGSMLLCRVLQQTTSEEAAGMAIVAQNIQTAWRQIVFSPVISIHYLIFAIPAFFAVIFCHRWALIWMTVFSFLIVMGLAVMCASIPGDFYKTVLPYMVCMAVPAFYHLIAVNKVR